MTTPAISSTVSARSGDVLTIPATLAHPDGSPINLTGATVTFQMVPPLGGSPVNSGVVVVTSPTGGQVTYTAVSASDTAQAGEFRGYFLVTFPGVPAVAYPADGILVAIYPLITATHPPQQGPCFPWTTDNAVRGAVAGIDANADLTDWIAAASQVLHALTGRQFQGLCRATIRPGHDSCSCGGMCGAHAWGWPFSGGFYPFSGWGGYGGGWYGFASEGPRNLLICASEIDLGADCRYVESIKIDGAEVDPTTWRLDPLGKLVRQADAAGNPLVWPCCQRVDLPSGAVGTFEIAYTYGADPPEAVVMAVNVLAGEFWLAANGAAGQCKLPARVQTITRQGTTATFVTDVTVMLERGYTGLSLVDTVIRAVNPYHLQRRARVLSPDIDPSRWMR
ncbi:MAG: hypothetical protein ABR532_08990 [Candidatus Dormibacteria bacterium]